MSECDHVMWLERIYDEEGIKKFWPIHSANDASGGKVPEEIPGDHIVYNFCPMCGDSLK